MSDERGLVMDEWMDLTSESDERMEMCATPLLKSEELWWRWQTMQWRH